MLSKNKKSGFTPTPNLASRLSAKPQLMPKLVSGFTPTPKILVCGFTFLETIVAVGILTIALASPLMLASSSIRAAGLAKNKFIASYLAAEAIEFIKNARDNNIIAGSLWLETIFDKCEKGCTVDVSKNGLGNALSKCGSTCDKVKYNSLSGFYNQEQEFGTNKETKFTRIVKIEQLIQDQEAKIIVTVSWAGPGSPLIIQDNIFNWR